MDNDLKIKLGQFKSVDSINVDNNVNLFLETNKKNLTEFDVKNVLDVSEQFNNERDNILDYRFYGKINYFSLLNGLDKNYYRISDFFLPVKTNNKNFLNSFEIYLLIPHTGYTSHGVNYVKNYRVVADLGTIVLNSSGYDVNIFGDQNISYNILNSINIENLLDGFELPITEMFLYFQYLPGENGDGIDEVVSRIEFNNGVQTINNFIPTTLNIDDIIENGDLVNFNLENFTETTLVKQKYVISMRIGLGPTIKFYYNPFIPIKLRYFSDNVSRANTRNTANEVVNNIPDYAKELDNNGNFIWRNILDDGFIDPITGEGNDFPFVNGKKYVYSTINLFVRPDLTNTNTINLFNEINFNDPTTLTNQPTSDLNDIGKLCR